MRRFTLKTYCIGFIVPFYDGNDKTGLTELAQSITDRYLEWFDTLKIDLEQKTYPDQNPVILFTLVVRVDHSLVRDDQLEGDWNKLKDGIKSDLESFFNARKLLFDIVE